MEIYYLIDILIEVDEGVYEYVPEKKQTSNVIPSISLLHPNLFQIKEKHILLENKLLKDLD